LASGLIYLGGNGHCAARLAPARDVLARLVADGTIPAFTLFDVPYPGFEDRPRAADLDHFLADLLQKIGDALAAAETSLIYATGIGGLLVLGLRARGELRDVPILLQAPVLWGLEHRLMPRLMRLRPVRGMLHWLFARTWFQRRFVRRYFERGVSNDFQQAFFAGYAHCPAAADFFAWLTPAYLRDLERRFAERPDALQGIRVWWGERDRVVGLDELARTESVLGVHWPIQTFPHWGHYPMIDEPEAWVRAISDVLAATPAIR
jgi:pimeloyl-ACP methyl ester carboxylesterase